MGTTKRFSMEARTWAKDLCQLSSTARNLAYANTLPHTIAALSGRNKTHNRNAHRRIPLGKPCKCRRLGSAYLNLLARQTWQIHSPRLPVYSRNRANCSDSTKTIKAKSRSTHLYNKKASRLRTTASLPSLIIRKHTCASS